MDARVTFVIPAYNAANTIQSTIGSLEAQSETDWRAIVVDDGSEDATAEIVSAIAARDSRVRLVRTGREGVCRARNTGVELATTEWVTFLDADDRIDPLFLGRMMAAGTNADLIYCGSAFI